MSPIRNAAAIPAKTIPINAICTPPYVSDLLYHIIVKKANLTAKYCVPFPRNLLLVAY